MFIVLLKFASAQSRACEFMVAHKAWLDQGFAEGMFAPSGSLMAAGGGFVLPINALRPDLEHRVVQDPFVVRGGVSAEIIETRPSRADEHLQRLLA